MIIQSQRRRGCSVNYFNELVGFDNEGKAEVSKELGEKIIKNFYPSVWEDGKRPETKVSVVDVGEELGVAETRLKEEVSRLHSVIEGKDKEIDRLKESENTWREAFQKLQDKSEIEQVSGQSEIEQVSGQKDGLAETKTNIDIVSLTKKYGEIPEGTEQIVDELSRKNLNQIKSWIKSQGLASEEEIKDKSDRVGLIKFVLSLLK